MVETPTPRVHDDAACPISRALDVIGQKWSMLIIRDALAGRSRFTEFQANLKIPKATLAARLQALTAQGILETRPMPGRKACCDYVLTDRGKALACVMLALHQWGSTHLE